MKKKIVILGLALVLAFALGIGGTLAWLTAQTGTVTNTFTVGDINMTLKEYKVAGNTKTELAANARSFKAIPGGTDSKQPELTVTAGSEKCYVYACIENTVKLNDGTKVATVNVSDTDWVKIGENGDKAVYRYIGSKATSNVVDAMSADVTVTVFTTVTYSESITKANRSQITTDDKITIQGFAYQADNRTQADADAAACTQFSVTAISAS